MSEHKKYRAVFVPAIENSNIGEFTMEFDTPEQAQAALDAIARYTLFLHRNELMVDYSNTGSVEEFVDGEWEELDEDD